MTAPQQSIASVRIAAAAAARLTAGDIAAYDVTVPVAITEIMLVVTASNERQVLAVAQEIEKDLYLKDGHREPLAREGLEEAQWVLLDFGDFVVHVMHEDAREFYALDRLWGRPLDRARAARAPRRRCRCRRIRRGACRSHRPRRPCRVTPHRTPADPCVVTRVPSP